MRIALVHDYLCEYGGAERVLEALHQLYPDAPVFTSFVDQNALGPHWSRFSDWDIRVSWLKKIPFHKKLFSPLRIFAPQYFRAFDFRGYDVVISSSNAYFAKAVQVPKPGVHICYCHTPARSLYGYATTSTWQTNKTTQFFGKLINHYLRVVDVKVAQDVDVFIANSAETAARIEKFYRRSSTVVFPPVTMRANARLTPMTDRTYYLYVNRLALAKHPELAVEVCTARQLPLKVVGDGKMLPQLKAIAGPTVEFLGAVGDVQLSELYADAKALLYPVEDEDFGIVPIEAMSFGTPVIAHRSGGPRETIIDKKTGYFFDELTSEGLSNAITQVSEVNFSVDAIQKHAQQFNADHFASAIQKIVTESVALARQS